MRPNRAQRERFRREVYNLLDLAESLALADDELFLVGYPEGWPDFNEMVSAMREWHAALDADLKENP